MLIDRLTEHAPADSPALSRRGFLSIGAALGGGLLIGANNVPGAWYEGLQKPWFNPPNWIFAPVWTVLYVLIGIAGWLVWRRRDRPALTLWFLQMGLNFIWTPVFFGANLLGPALGIALGTVSYTHLTLPTNREV